LPWREEMLWTPSLAGSSAGARSRHRLQFS
jgi:hypothetical protein